MLEAVEMGRKNSKRDKNRELFFFLFFFIKS